MDISNPNLHGAFQRIVEALAKLSPEEIQRLNDPQYIANIRVVKVKREKETKAHDVLNDAKTETIIQTLAQFADRQEAIDFLATECVNKTELETIARSLDISILKNDKIMVLREKIVEATVGAKIRSQAIQGKTE